MEPRQDGTDCDDNETEKPTETNPSKSAVKPREIGGPTGPEPTRFGDWERNGRCSDF